MEELVWALLIYSAGIVAMFIELFLPGAILGTIGFLAVCGSVVYSYATGHTTAGTILVVCTIAFIPLFFLAWKNIVGKFWALSDSEANYRASNEPYEELLGKEGYVTALLRPSGTATIDDKRYPVITRGEMLQKGTPVKVIDVSGNRITVTRL